VRALPFSSTATQNDAEGHEELFKAPLGSALCGEDQAICDVLPAPEDPEELEGAAVIFVITMAKITNTTRMLAINNPWCDLSCVARFEVVCGVVDGATKGLAEFVGGFDGDTATIGLSDELEVVVVSVPRIAGAIEAFEAASRSGLIHCLGAGRLFGFALIP
jgi:hypothetical protein